VPTDSGFPLHPTTTFADLTTADILCVPGGFGTVDAMQDGATLDWVRRVGEGADWVTSVCTGALVLGAAGLLKGYRATTHWASHEQLAFFGATPVKERVVVDRNRVTGGGVTSGIDFGLRLISEIRGEAHAKFVQLSVEYDPQPPFDSGDPAKADPETLERYWALVNKAGPGRVEMVRAIAKRLVFDA
jgi:cyclohexyl-isocyanide hydratase